MLILTLIVSFGISVLGGPIYESPEAITEVCVGGKKRLNWKYSNVSELDYAIWTKETTQIAYISGTSTAVFDPLFQDKFDYISDGTLELQDAVLSDAGKYKFNVVYKGSSGLPVDDTSTDLNVLDPPAVPTGNCTGSGSSRQCTCTASSLGTPAADVKIKVDSKLQASEEATVDLTQTADCCVIGDAAKCITENTTGSTEYCVNIVGTTATNTPKATSITSSTAGATSMPSILPTPKTASTTTTMTALPTITTTPATTTTPPAVTTSTTGRTTIRLATPEVSTSTGTTITTRRVVDSDKGTVTMIIVVSVIGGILVIGVIFMLFLLGHWKSCFGQKGHRKHVHHSSHKYVGHRTHQKKSKHNIIRGRCEYSSNQPHHQSGDYSFYRGVQNPVFVETVDDASFQDMYNRNTPQYSAHSSRYPYVINWEEM